MRSAVVGKEKYAQTETTKSKENPIERLKVSRD